MDGNGRWAKRRGEPRKLGHQEGLAAAKRIVKAASDMGLSYLTLYTFSTENWKRAATEVGFLMGLVKQFLKKELKFCLENRIRVRHAGSREELPEDVLEELDSICLATKDFDKLQVILAMNYGGRDEIVRAVKRLLVKGMNSASLAESLSEEQIAGHLDNPDVPDPDLIIRTAGEFRISNFLLWEAAYAEYYFSGKLWPDWTGEDLSEAVSSYKSRERRYGAVPGEVL
jgi:undecaprenyl diphosphate synthase